MSISSYFYYGVTRKYVIAFGTLFNGINIHRKDGKVIEIPLTYASKERFYLRLKQNPDLNKQEAIDLPRIGFVLSDITYDSERKQPSLGKFTEESPDSMKRKSMYLPVPYDFLFELSIYTRNVDDGLQIMEQIVPFFKPSFNITINEIDEMGVIRDIPIVLETVSGPIEDEGDFTGERLNRWDLNFVLKGNYYGPIGEQPLIKKVYVDYKTSQNGEYLESIDERYRVTIDPETAKPEDVWVYNEEFISKHTSNGQDINLPEEDIKTNQFLNDTAYFSDYCILTIT